VRQESASRCARHANRNRCLALRNAYSVLMIGSLIYNHSAAMSRGFRYLYNKYRCVILISLPSILYCYTSRVTPDIRGFGRLRIVNIILTIQFHLCTLFTNTVQCTAIMRCIRSFDSGIHFALRTGNDKSNCTILLYVSSIPVTTNMRFFRLQ